MTSSATATTSHRMVGMHGRSRDRRRHHVLVVDDYDDTREAIVGMRKPIDARELQLAVQRHCERHTIRAPDVLVP